MNSCKNHQTDFRCIDKNSIIVDAGACQGTFIDFIRSKLYCKIYAIEPCKSNFIALEDKNYTDVSLFNFALVGPNTDQYVIFKEYIGLPEWGSIYDKELAHKHPKFKAEESYEVETMQITDIFKTLCIDHIDYLKMDIEGAEFDVLSSMDINMASKIYQLSVEVHTRDNTKIMSLVSNLENLNYTCEWFADKLELWAVKK